MLEISMTDLLLFAWAAIATGFAFKYREEIYVHKFVIHKVITDEKIREQLIASHKKFEGSNT